MTTHSLFDERAEPADIKRAELLRADIIAYNHAYYTLGKPRVSDDIYNGLFRELQQLEARFPELLVSSSPTQTVGAPGDTNLAPVRHKVSMLSIRTETDHSEQAVWKFDASVKDRFKEYGNDVDVTYFGELKYDGLAVNLRYVEGTLTQASTRGDGSTGEDVTWNIWHVEGVPDRLKYPVPLLEVRGEIMMRRSVFLEVNKRREMEGEKPYANPRNAASGILRSFSKSFQSRPKESLLLFIPYGLGEFQDNHNNDHSIPGAQSRLLGWFSSQGFIYPEYTCLSKDPRSLVNFHTAVQKARATLDFEIDGVVYKVDDFGQQTVLGSRSREPRWAVAHKFPPEQAVTTVQEIHVQVGKTGKLTPVAQLAPVQVGGVVVTYVNLYNEAKVHDKDIRVGDVVTVHRAGDVIPEIVNVHFKYRQKGVPMFFMPDKCPACGSPVVQNSDADHQCSAKITCPAQTLAKFTHFVSRSAMDIEGLGEKVLAQLLEQKMVEDVADLYILDLASLCTLPKIQHKTAIKLLHAIEVSKTTTLAKVLFALGIRHVGEFSAQVLALHYRNLDSLQKATVDDLTGIREVGEIMAKSIVQWFSEQGNQVLVQKLQGLGVTWDEPSASSQETKSAEDPLEGVRVALTGTLSSMARHEAITLIQSRKAIYSLRVTKTTKYLVVGDDPGDKVLEAMKLGTVNLTEQEFIDLFKQRT